MEPKRARESNPNFLNRTPLIALFVVLIVMSMLSGCSHVHQGGYTGLRWVDESGVTSATPIDGFWAEWVNERPEIVWWWK